MAAGGVRNELPFFVVWYSTRTYYYVLKLCDGAKFPIADCCRTTESQPSCTPWSLRDGACGFPGKVATAPALHFAFRVLIITAFGSLSHGPPPNQRNLTPPNHEHSKRSNVSVQNPGGWLA